MGELRAGESPCRDGNGRPFAGPFGRQISLTRLSRRIRPLPCWICTTRMGFWG